MSSDSVTAKYNQAELKQCWRRDSEQCLITKALGGATRTTRIKMRVEDPTASRLGESSDKTLSAKHAYQT